MQHFLGRVIGDTVYAQDIWYGHRYNNYYSIVKELETGLINTFPADSPRCAVDNIVDSFHGCF